jgi:hypothetical protein
MRYPKTGDIGSTLEYLPIIPLAKIVGEREHYNFESRTTAWRAASQAVATVCKIIPDGHSAKISRSLSKAKNTAQLANTEKPNQNRFSDIQAYIRLLTARNQPNETQRILYDIHENTIDRLHRIPVAEKWPFANRQKDLGFVAELTCLALINRYAHPALVALPALEKHDQGTQAGFKNYDVAAGVSSIEPSGQPESHLLQVKLGCAGWCGEENITGYDVRRTETVLEAQHSSVALVSGCCDLGIKQNLPLAEQSFELLKAEYSDTISEEGIKRLDVLSDNLLFSLGAAHRMGRFDLHKNRQAV